MNIHVFYRENLQPGIQTHGRGVVGILAVYFKPKSMIGHEYVYILHFLIESHS